MPPTIELRLAPSDWWRTHGPLNALATLASLLLVPVVALLVLPIERSGFDLRPWQAALTLVALLFFVRMNQGVLCSLLAIVSKRPSVSIDEAGIRVDKGPWDRWFFEWSAIAALAPRAKTIAEALASGRQVGLTLALHTRPARRLLSNVQHSVHHDHFEVSGFFRPLEADELERLIGYLDGNVPDQQPFLLMD